MKNQIFREKSVQKVSSPEQLDNYVKVSTPSVWITLIAVIVLLIGICVWGVLGNLDTVVNTVGVSEQGTLTCYLTEADIEKIQDGMTIKVGDTEIEVASVSEKPVQIIEGADEYMLHLGGFAVGDWVYEITAKTDVPQGTYEVSIIIDSISPMSFVLN